MSRNKLFNFHLKRNSDFIEIGGGEGELSASLVNSGYKFILYVEPNNKRFKIARKKLYSINCQCKDISKIDFSDVKPGSKSVIVIMQDVIEHISKKKLKDFFIKLSNNYSKVYFIGRTPNLKSPFGLRNSFGDNTHIHRFTDSSLKDFLQDLGFSQIHISNENYRITGIVSFLRYFPYLIIIYTISLKFAIVYGTWEGLLTPNILFHSETI
tara:strand:+ start:122 stop:754 length:633 start_codon:yes stop_codon:yes gene_type:complete